MRVVAKQGGRYLISVDDDLTRAQEDRRAVGRVFDSRVGLLFSEGGLHSLASQPGGVACEMEAAETERLLQPVLSASREGGRQDTKQDTKTAARLARQGARHDDHD